MSSASSPRQGGPSPSTSSSNPVRYTPYQKPNGIQMVAANGVRPMMAMGAPQIAMAPNGQMMMAANQLGNPVQARLGTPYMVGGGMGGGMVMMPNGQMAMTAGQMGGGQIMMTPQGQMIQAPAGQIQVQYVQPPIGIPGQPGHGVIQSQPVSYAQNAAVSNPPPPPQGNPPMQNDNQAQQAGSRSSTPQTKSEHGLPSKEGGGYPSNALGPDFNHENERLQTLVQELRAETAKLTKDKNKLREKVKKLSRQNDGATKSYTVKDGKCPFCQQEMPAKNNRK